MQYIIEYWILSVQACRKFINNNAVTKAANMSSKSPELLARYCDLLLKKSSKNPEEAELEDTLNQVVSCDFFSKNGKWCCCLLT